MSKTKIRKLPTGAFSGCTYLANVKVSDTTEDIASKVFVDNEDLKNINIPLAATLTDRLFMDLMVLQQAKILTRPFSLITVQTLLSPYRSRAV